MEEKKQNTQIVKKDESGFFNQAGDKASNVTLLTNGLIKFVEDKNLQLPTSGKILSISVADAINSQIDKAKLKMSDFSRSQLFTAMWYAVKNGIDPSNGEAYFDIRKGQWDEEQKKYGKPTIYCKPQGEGNIKIIRQHGDGLKQLYGPYICRENDEFTYPSFDGIDIILPKLVMKSGYGKVKRLYYIALMQDGTYKVLLSEREQLEENIKSHIQNNILGATKASQSKLMAEIANKTFEQIMDDKTLITRSLDTYDFKEKKVFQKEYTLISKAWTGPAREEMIITKLKNNCVKRFPIKIDDEILMKGYETSFEDYDQYKIDKNNAIDNIETPTDVQKEVEDNTAKALTTNANATSIPLDVTEKKEEAIPVSPISNDGDDDIPF